MNTSGRARFVRLAGRLLTAASLVFLLVVIGQRWNEIRAVSIAPNQWLVVAGCAVIYGLSLFLLAGAWHCLLASVGAPSPGLRRSIYAYATSQLAKFVPGNVFHILGRHLIHRSDGLPHARLGLASLIEIALMVSGAVIVVVLAAVVEPPQAIEGILPSIAPYLIAAALVAGIALIGAAWKLGRASVLWALASLSAYAIFFAIMGAIVARLVDMLTPASSYLVAGEGVAAWLIGFLTPGAPAGVGTREATLLFLARGEVPQGALIVAIALFRLVTLLGDLLCFALGQLLFRKA